MSNPLPVGTASLRRFTLSTFAPMKSLVSPLVVIRTSPNFQSWQGLSYESFDHQIA